MRALLLSVLAMAAGCAAHVPGDGRLVLVVIDDGLANVQLPVEDADGSNPRTMTLGDSVRAGVRYWDAVGAKLRVPEDVTPEDGEPAATLHLVQASAFDELFEDRSAWYSSEDGDIHVPSDRLLAMAGADGHFVAATMTALWAHESGHAMGLQHEHDDSAVMYPENATRDNLAPADVAQFCRVVSTSAAACSS